MSSSVFDLTFTKLDGCGWSGQNNYVIFVTVITLLAAYVLLMIVFYLLDRRDRRKYDGLTIMTNFEHEMDQFYYLLTVITGTGFDCGTTSNVCIQLYGTLGRSQVYVLRETDSPVLKAGGIDTFLISSPKRLGKMERVRLWHDNSGPSPSWFCRKIIVKDLKTEKDWKFFISRWIHVSGKESTLIYQKNVASKKDLTNFTRRFRQNISEHFDNSHLWWSIFSHPTASRYTRCQRFSCAFALLCFYLMTNIVAQREVKEIDKKNDWYSLIALIPPMKFAALEVPLAFLLMLSFTQLNPRLVPTLIIWYKGVKSMHRTEERRGTFFTPKRPSYSREDDDDDEYASMMPRGADTTTNSLHHANVEEFESWVGKKAAESKPYRENMQEILIHGVSPKLEDELEIIDMSSHPPSEEAPPEEEPKKKEKPPEPEWENEDIVFETCQMKLRHKDACSLPWWCIVFSWTLCIITTIICLYFALLCGLHYDKKNDFDALDFLIGTLVSFVFSIFLIQPFNICLIAFIFTLLCSDHEWKITDERRFQLITKHTQHEDGRDLQDSKGKEPLHLNVSIPKEEHPPLDEAVIFELKLEARRRERVRYALSKLLLYLVLLIPLVIFAYLARNVNEQDYMMVSSMQKLLEADTKDEEINTLEEAYEYIEENVVTVMYYYQDDVPPILPGEDEHVRIADGTNILLGIPRIRQLRVKPEKCRQSIPVQAECYPDYHPKRTQETRSFLEGWKNVSENGPWKFRGLKGDKFPRSGWTYGYKKSGYDGGGYVVQLSRTARETRRIIQEEMHDKKWLDQKTRAVILEFSVLNPNINRLLDVIILIERSPSHSFETSFRITPVHLKDEEELKANTSPIKIGLVLLIACVTILLAIVIWNFCVPSELYAYKKFWFWLDAIMVACIVISLSVYTKEYLVRRDLKDKVLNMNQTEYVSLHEAVYWDHIDNVSFSFTLCLCFLKIWRLLIFLEGGFLVTSLTVGLVSHLILAYFLLVFTALMAFAFSGHILFGNATFEFRTVWRSFITLVGQALNVKIFSLWYEADPSFGPVYGSVFGFMLAFLFVNILIAILSQARVDAKMIAEEKFRNWGLKETCLHVCLEARDNKSKKKKKKKAPKSKAEAAAAAKKEKDHPPPPLFELQPHRLEAMKKETRAFFEAALRSNEMRLLTRMKKEAQGKLGPHQKLVRTKKSLLHSQAAKEIKINEMRVHAARFLQERIGADMDIAEIEVYNDVHKIIMGARISRLERLVDEIGRKIRWR